ncbi:metal ABC transporter permease [Carboxylicivirga sp. N1Y90]|uniref:metal ABC transporter permease n=1 Tax=Carboxylicivirga fragile TaxID=3417571 RepID=UPI003D33579B|nr:metal ABC transporter permease [Marinilabiliaceae bacterium N1Y90]
MTDFIDLFSYAFFQNALLASILTSVLAGIIGTYVVARRSVFISGGITHASFGGMGIAYYFGFPPFLGAGIFAILSSLGIEWTSNKAGLREDSAIAILWSLGMAIGIIFVFLTPGYTPNLMGFLFGDILTVKQTDLIWLGAISLSVVLLIRFFYDAIIITAFDPDYAKTTGLPVKTIRYTVSIFIAIAIVLSIKVMGIILVLSLFTIPPSAANLFSKSYKKVMFLAVVISLVGSIIGLFMAYVFDLPSGATIILTLTGFYTISRIYKLLATK